MRTLGFRFRHGSAGKGQRGFTLIEVLVALIIMGMGLSGVLAMLRQESETQLRVASRLNQQRQARLIMERMLLDPEMKDGIKRGKVTGGVGYVLRVEDLGSWEDDSERPEGESKKRRGRLAARAPRLMGVQLCVRSGKKGNPLCLECDRMLR